MLLGKLGACLLGNLLAGNVINRAGEDLLEQVMDLKKRFLISPHPLTNFEIQKYYQNESLFNGVYSIDHLPDKKKRWDICNKS